MLLRIFPPYVMMDMVYPDNSSTMHKRSFSGHDIYVIAGLLFTGLGYCCVNIRILLYLLYIFSFRYLRNKVESGLKTHESTRGSVQLSLSEII